MEEEFFKIGYVPYWKKEKIKKQRWTSKIFNHKTIIIIGLIIAMCFITNFILIYKFITILETNRIF